MYKHSWRFNIDRKSSEDRKSPWRDLMIDKLTAAFIHTGQIQTLSDALSDLLTHATYKKHKTWQNAARTNKKLQLFWQRTRCYLVCPPFWPVQVAGRKELWEQKRKKCIMGEVVVLYFGRKRAAEQIYNALQSRHVLPQL